MYLSFLSLPLLSFLLISLLGRYLGNKGLLKLISLNLNSLLLLSILMIYENYLIGNILKINIWTNLYIDIFWINYYLYFDDLSQLMLLIIISITLLVFIYTYDYMISDPHIIRFYFYIILFIFFMIILITTNSLPILFIGWEGVGLSSFLLISFWYSRFNTQIGGLIALLMNRIGDIFYLLGLFLSLIWLGSYDIISLSINSYLNIDFLLISFIIAAMAKSAQIFLHIWLPYSMEGPTPISALIHAATMVTAGIYLLLRLNNLIIFSYYTTIFIIIIGTLTAFIGGSLALISLDIKELIAYSTMSQLGYMISILSLKYNNLAFYHLIFHAYFKALLFLIAGAIIHTIFDIQDFRKMGGLMNLLPFQSIISIIGLFSLIGFPFTTGFYSKESILNNSYSLLNLLGHYTYIILLISALLTIFYSLNFYKYIFLNETKLSLFSFKYLTYFSFHLLIPLIILSIITIFFGYIFYKWIYLSNLNSLVLSFNIPFIIKFIPLIFMIFIIIFSYLSIFYYNIYCSILFNQFSFKLLYSLISGLIFNISYRILFKLFDYGFLDLIGPIFVHYLNSNNIYKKYFNINFISLLFFIFILFIY